MAAPQSDPRLERAVFLSMFMVLSKGYPGGNACLPCFSTAVMG